MAGAISGRIYADFNGLEPSSEYEGRLAVPLDTVGSLQDLSNAGVRLREGDVLTIYDASDENEDLEASAIARYDRPRRIWIAELGPAGYSYVSRTVQKASTFLCVGCRYDLGAAPSQGGALPWPPRVCPSCGLETNAALAPPAA